jgi:hypothetical protein
VASPAAPPPVEIALDGVPYDDQVEVVEENDFERSEKTDLVRRCPSCGGDFITLEDTDQPPVSYKEAWGGEYKGACRGTRDPSIWSWCRGPIGEGRLICPSRGSSHHFHERRTAFRVVDVDRRGK